MSFLKFISAKLSQPKTDKVLFKTIRELKPRQIVQLGLGDGERASRIIDACTEHGDVSVCGIDWFEGAPSGVPHMSIKDAHRQLSRENTKVKLVPGEPAHALKRCANDLMGTDLLIISAAVPKESLVDVWSYAPRMLTNDSRVLIENQDLSGWTVLAPNAIPKPKRRNAA